MQNLETVEKVVKGNTFLNVQLPQLIRRATLAPAHQANWLLVLAQPNWLCLQVVGQCLAYQRPP